jgi:hypothetical protein
MKRLILCTFFIVLVGCATGYQKHTWSGGFKDKKIDENHYMVEYYGNGTTSRETVEDFWQKRASELCPSGFSIVESITGANDGGIFVGPAVSIKHPWKKSEIKCK